MQLAITSLLAIVIILFNKTSLRRGDHNIVFTLRLVYTLLNDSTCSRMYLLTRMIFIFFLSYKLSTWSWLSACNILVKMRIKVKNVEIEGCDINSSPNFILFHHLVHNKAS